MYIGYARVSTVGQDLEQQIDLLEEAGCEKIFVEKVTGTSTAKRHELKQAMEYVRDGDLLVVTKIDRLARSVIDLHNIINDLKERGVGVSFLQDRMTFNPYEKMDSTQNLLFNVLGSFAQFERDLIVQRTSEGRERAKRAGKKLGRKGQPESEVKRALKLYFEREQNGLSVKDIADMTKVPAPTIYEKARKIKQEETEKELAKTLAKKTEIGVQ